MLLKPIYPYDFWSVTIDWSKPVHYENIGSYDPAKDSKYDLYMITGKYSSHPHKLFYVGKTYSQTISMRLGQTDHRKRMHELRKAYPNHKLFVSCGRVTIEDSRRSPIKIDEIESILIYSFDTKAKINKNKNYSLNVVDNHYIITNRGYKSELRRKIYFGLFFEK